MNFGLDIVFYFATNACKNHTAKHPVYARITTANVRFTMALGIIIHITVGTEKRTEFFSQERIRIGSDEASDLQIHTPHSDGSAGWFDLENADGVYRSLISTRL